MRVGLSLLLIAVMLALAAAARADVDLRAGDRVVFLGDSITAGHMYTRMIEQYMLLRYPDRPMTFVNSGVGGHTAADGLARLDRDVQAWHPTVVVVNFGMNDAGSPPTVRSGAFESNIQAVLDAVASMPGVRRVVWADTTPFDTDGLRGSDPGAKREARIRELVAFARREGAHRNLAVACWHDVLSSLLEQFRAVRHGRELISDRVHPGLAGHAVMALELLRVLGEEPQPSQVVARLAGGTLSVSGERGQREIVWDGRGPVTIDLRDTTPPIPWLRAFSPDDPAPRAIENMARLGLRIEGLPSGRWRVESAGDVLGRWSSRDLARGVDLMESLPRLAQAKKATATARRRTYGDGVGALWLDDAYRLWDMAQAKDRVRHLLRGDELQQLPRFAAGFEERYTALLAEWFDDAVRHLWATATEVRGTPREIRILRDGH